MKHILGVGLFFLTLLWLSGCNSKDDSNLSESFAELQNGPPRAAATLVSAFGIESGNQAGAVIAFYSGQRYFSGVVQRVSDVHYRIAATIGLYQEQNGSFAFRGYRTTCRYLAEKYKGVAKVAGSVNGNYLTVTSGATTTVLARIHSAPPSAPNGFVIEWGCFDERTGAFTPESWSNL